MKKKCPNCRVLVNEKSKTCFNCNFDLINGRLDTEKLERERKEQEVKRISTEAGNANLSEKIKINDLYEYDVVTITDKSTGAMDIVSLQNVLSERGN